HELMDQELLGWRRKVRHVASPLGPHGTTVSKIDVHRKHAVVTAAESCDEAVKQVADGVLARGSYNDLTVFVEGPIGDKFIARFNYLLCEHPWIFAKHTLLDEHAT